MRTGWIMAGLVAALTVAGCASLSPTPEDRYYSLCTAASEESSEVCRCQARTLSAALGPKKFGAFVDVLQDEGGNIATGSESALRSRMEGMMSEEDVFRIIGALKTCAPEGMMSGVTSR